MERRKVFYLTRDLFGFGSIPTFTPNENTMRDYLTMPGLLPYDSGFDPYFKIPLVNCYGHSFVTGKSFTFDKMLLDKNEIGALIDTLSQTNFKSDPRRRNRSKMDKYRNLFDINSVFPRNISVDAQISISPTWDLNEILEDGGFLSIQNLGLIRCLGSPVLDSLLRKYQNEIKETTGDDSIMGCLNLDVCLKNEITSRPVRIGYNRETGEWD